MAALGQLCRTPCHLACLSLCETALSAAGDKITWAFSLPAFLLSPQEELRGCTLLSLFHDGIYGIWSLVKSRNCKSDIWWTWTGLDGWRKRKIPHLQNSPLFSSIYLGKRRKQTVSCPGGGNLLLQNPSTLKFFQNKNKHSLFYISSRGGVWGTGSLTLSSVSSPSSPSLTTRLHKNRKTLLTIIN